MSLFLIHFDQVVYGKQILEMCILNNVVTAQGKALSYTLESERLLIIDL